MRPKPIRNSGNPPGPGTSMPMGPAESIRAQPRMFLAMNQIQSPMLHRPFLGWASCSSRWVGSDMVRVTLLDALAPLNDPLAVCRSTPFLLFPGGWGRWLIVVAHRGEENRGSAGSTPSPYHRPKRY